MRRPRLDIKDKMPSGMEEYLAQNGWHFNKKLCMYAVSKMRKKSEDKQVPIQFTSKEDLEKMLVKANIELENNIGYDAVYVYHMAKADYVGSSISDETHLLKFVKDYLDDVDGYDGIAMTRFYADIIGSGSPIMWEDMI